MNVSERASQDCFCPKYLKLVSENARLKDEIARLKAKLSRQERTAREQPFGLSTPSSKQLIKPSLPELSEAEVKRRKGGASVGHAGHGWKEPDGPEPETEVQPALEACPCCGGALESFPAEEYNVRELIDCNPLPTFRRRVKVPTHYCPRCRKPVRPRIDGVLPKTRLTNNVLARTATDHYLDGIPMGVVARRLNVAKGVLFNGMHRLAEIFQPATDGLLRLLRDAAIKQADETSWRTDGDNGYAWVFIAGQITIFVCEQTRSSSVPSAVLADCIGKLMTDRYAAYNCFNGKRGYCLEHLKRDTLKIVVDNPNSKECLAFTTELVPWLSMAMSLRAACAGDNVTYLLRAAFIRRKIEVIVEASARHPSVQRIQNIFRENTERLWLWTTDPRMPADNNAAERAIRPLAIARKVSHGSISAKGRKTRGVMMSVLHRLNACCTDPAAQLVKALNHYAQDRNANMFDRVFGGLPLYVPTQ